ncbi:MAG: hypothetical protein ACXWIH_30065, partial [Burkholderiales bacterium]
MLRLNAFGLEYSSNRFTAYRREVPDPADLKCLREEFGADWFVHWRNGVAWGIPRAHQPDAMFGTRTHVTTADYEGLSLLSARTGDQLPTFLPQYPALHTSKKGFRFVARKHELVSQAVCQWRHVPELLTAFQVRPRFSCESRLIELENGQLRIVLVVGISMHWDIQATIPTLLDAGIDMCGLYAVRRIKLPQQRNLLGRIRTANATTVCFDEAFADLESLSTEEVSLEPSKMSFARCLKHLLGKDYDLFRSSLEREEATFLGGPGYDQCLQGLTPALTKHAAIYIADGISVKVGERVELRTLEKPREVAYCYDPGRTKQHSMAWSGLSKYGPFSHDSFPKRAPNLLVVCP